MARGVSENFDAYVILRHYVGKAHRSTSREWLRVFPGGIKQNTGIPHIHQIDHLTVCIVWSPMYRMGRFFKYVERKGKRDRLSETKMCIMVVVKLQHHHIGESLRVCRRVVGTGNIANNPQTNLLLATMTDCGMQFLNCWSRHRSLLTSGW